MMEDKQTRRGEPVLVIDDRGAEREGTIEFGDDDEMSIYCEFGGRVVIRENVTARVRPDPNGQRPVWTRVAGQTAGPATGSRDKRDLRVKLDAASARIADLERQLAEATTRGDDLQSECAARQIREDDLAARLLKSERRSREYEQIIARRADERKRGQ